MSVKEVLQIVVAVIVLAVLGIGGIMLIAAAATPKGITTAKEPAAVEYIKNGSGELIGFTIMIKGHEYIKFNGQNGIHSESCPAQH